MNSYKRKEGYYELELSECMKNIKQSEQFEQEMIKFGNKIMSQYFIEHEFPLTKMLSDIYFDKYNIKFRTTTGILDFGIGLSIANTVLTMDEIKEIYFKKEYQDGCYVFE